MDNAGGSLTPSEINELRLKRLMCQFSIVDSVAPKTYTTGHTASQTDRQTHSLDLVFYCLLFEVLRATPKALLAFEERVADRAPAGIEAVAQVPMTVLSPPCCCCRCPAAGEVFAFAALYATAAHFYYLLQP